MRKIETKLALLMVAVLVMCGVVLTGCQSKFAPADQVVGAMYDLVIKENATPMKDLLEFASEDDVRSFLLAGNYTEMTDMLKDQFGGFGIDFTDKEIQRISDAMTGLLNKLSYTTKIQNGTKDETTVPLKMTGYSSDGLAQIMNDLITEMQTNMDEKTTTTVMSDDEETVQKLMQDVIKQFVAKVGEMEPSAETTDVTVKCEKMKVEVSGKEKVPWMPVDIDKLVSDLGGAIFKQDVQ